MTGSEKAAVEELVRICDVGDVTEGQMLKVDVGNNELLVCREQGRVHVLEDTCTHALASLSEGYVEGGKIFCPLHGGAFDIATGEAVRLPCEAPLQKFPVEIRDSGVWVRLTRPAG